MRVGGSVTCSKQGVICACKGKGVTCGKQRVECDMQRGRCDMRQVAAPRTAPETRMPGTSMRHVNGKRVNRANTLIARPKFWEALL